MHWQRLKLSTILDYRSIVVYVYTMTMLSVSFLSFEHLVNKWQPPTKKDEMKTGQQQREIESINSSKKGL